MPFQHTLRTRDDFIRRHWAIRDFTKAIELKPDDAEAHGNRRNAYGAGGLTYETLRSVNRNCRSFPAARRDGGDTVIGWNPKAELGRRFERPIKGATPGIKPVHGWGTIHRANAQRREGTGGARFAGSDQGAAGPGWAVDLASMPGNQVPAVGQCNFEFAWTENAWHRGEPEENPTGFVRVYSAEFSLLSSTALPGVIPAEIVPLSSDRFLIVGQARNPTAQNLRP